MKNVQLLFKVKKEKLRLKKTMTLYKNKIMLTNPQEILQEEMEYYKAVFSNEKQIGTHKERDWTGFLLKQGI